MFAFDYGWIAAVTFLILLVSVVVSALRARLWTSALAMILLIIMISGYSSMMTQSASASILFLIAGLVMGETVWKERHDERRSVGSEFGASRRAFVARSATRTLTYRQS